MSAADLHTDALALARAGWAVFPLRPRGKAPAGWLVPNGHREATTDPEIIGPWWARTPTANVGAPVPPSLVVVDVDPRNGAEAALAALEAMHGPLPVTLTSVTGGGGEHRFYLHPGVALTGAANALGPGVDVKLPNKGYVVLPPSVHPCGQVYRWAEPLVEPVLLPPWIAARLRPPTRPTPAPRRLRVVGDGPSVADAFCAATTWAEVLEPHGWVAVRQRGELTEWRRPAKHDGISATTNHAGLDLLHVFSASTPFEPDRSYTRFRAYAVLEHGGDLSAAAQTLRERVGAVA